MKILDTSGNPLEGCFSFDYRGCVISVSTVFNPDGGIAICRDGCFVNTGDLCIDSIPIAMVFVNIMVDAGQ